jgi:hypothetical protein
MVFRSPKYYAELRKFRREQERRDQARKLTSSQASGSKPANLPSKAQASSQSPQAPGSGDQGTSGPSPCPGDKQQE